MFNKNKTSIVKDLFDLTKIALKKKQQLKLIK